MLRFLSGLLVAFVWFVPTPASVAALPEQRALDLIPGESQFEVGYSLDFIKDEDGRLTVDQVLEGRHELQWRQSETRVPNHGLTQDVYWYLLTVENPTDTTLNRYLELGYPLLGYVDIYVLRDGRVQETIHTGAYRPFDTRQIKHRNLLVDLNLQPGEEIRTLLKISTDGPFQVPINLRKPNEFIANDQYALMVVVGFTGLMIAMAVYNLLIFFTVRDPSYLWYVFHVVGMIGILTMLDGLAFQLVWPNYPAINEHSMVLAIGVTIMAASAFAYLFLNVHRHARWLRGLLLAVSCGGGLLILLSLVTPYATAIRVAMIAAIISMPTMIFAGIYLWYKGEILARFYTMAWLLLLSGNALLAIEKFGAIPHVTGMAHVPKMGAAMEVMLLSFALAYRIRLERKQRFEAQALQLEAERTARATEENAKRELEYKVKARTHDLEVANRKLREISEIDGLTQVRNRQTFDRLLHSEWNRAARHGTMISLLMLDMDEFKGINDTYGHQCGDAALKSLARICEEMVDRAGDRVARYGGEEFVILLPGTDMEGAHCVAEKIRQALARTPQPWEEQEIFLTVSIGVSTRLPAPRTNPDELLRSADQALYAAKNSGRNRVVSETTVADS